MELAGKDILCPTRVPDHTGSEGSDKESPHVRCSLALCVLGKIPASRLLHLLSLSLILDGSIVYAH